MKCEKLFDFEIIQTEDIALDGTADGDLLLAPTCGGSFRGERLSGELLPVGMGIVETRGVCNDIHGSMLLRTEDGCDILMGMQAIFDVAPEVESELMSGASVDPSLYYYKGIVSFHTGASAYKWLERKVCVCEAIVDDWTKLRFTVYMI